MAISRGASFAVLCGLLLASPARAEFRVSTTEGLGPLDRLNNPDVAVHPSGASFVVWTRTWGPTNDDFMGQALDPSGNRVGPELTLGASNNSIEVASVTAQPSGGFAVTWARLGDVFVRVYDVTGNALGPASMINVAGGGGQNIASDAAGNLLVAWEEATSDLVVRGLDPTGTPVAPAAVAATGGVLGTSDRLQLVANGTGTFLLVWRSTGVYARAFDSTGTPLGAQILLHPTPRRPWAAVLPSGEFFVAWEDGSLYGVRLDSAGVPLAAAAVVGDATGALQSLAGLSDGTVVASGLFGEVLHFDETGVLGPTWSLPPNFTPAVVRLAGTPSGGFMAVWNTFQSVEGYEEVVMGELFAASWRPQGPLATDARRLIITDPDPARRRIVIQSTSPRIAIAPPDGFDPVADGARLHVYGSGGTADSACFDLSNGSGAGWSVSGTAEAPKFRYVDKAGVNGPCLKALVKPGRLFKVVCKATTGPIDYSLDEPEQGSVAVRFESGATTYCMEFRQSDIFNSRGRRVGGVVKKDQPGRLVAFGPLAPADCPPPPVSCP
jgi:hypothetical protein